MNYKDKLVKEIRISVPAGKAYQTEVPDTFDITEVAELTIRAITNRIDPKKGFLMYGRDNFYDDPPHLHFYWVNDGASEGKILEGLPLLRIMSGSRLNEDIEEGYMQSILRLTGEDGCFYLLPELYKNPATPPDRLEPHTSVDREGRHILALCMRYQCDENPTVRELIEKKINRLMEIAIYEDDYAYFTSPPSRSKEVSFTPYDTAGTLKDPSGGQGRFDIEQGWRSVRSAHQTNFQLTRSLCVYYKISGYKTALELAGKLVKGVIEYRKGYEEDGRWIIDHFHTATASLLAILEYAMIKQDRELIEFVNRCYEFGKASGEALTGYFPEQSTGGPLSLECRLCETCDVADMIGLAIKLTQAGSGEYWSDVERWVRNQFVENQLTAEKLNIMVKNLTVLKKQPIAPQKVDWMKKMIDTQNSQKASEEVTKVWVAGGIHVLESPMKKNAGENNDTVPYWMSLDIEKAVGTFSGCASPNDWGAISQHPCCTGNSSRTIYWIWDSIVTKDEHLVKVNLLMNRASVWLDIDSYLPHEGRVVLKIKDADKVAIRIPEWTDCKEVKCTVGSREYKYAWLGNYIVVDGLVAGDTVDIHFPVKTETLFKVIAGDTTYKLTFKGYTVVDIEPKGEICPLYSRDDYKNDVAPVKKVTRFIPDKKIIW